MITGNKIERPTKEQLADVIAMKLGLQSPAVAPGSSVDSTFLDRIYEALTKAPSTGTDAYRKTELVMAFLGLTYDPYWDTSELAPNGGSTVTTRAYSRICSALTGIPRCFILNVNDAPIGTQWESNHQELYRYDKNVSGRKPFTDAGPGARIVYYATHKATIAPKHFVASASVDYIEPGWQGPWTARLSEYDEFVTPVPVEEVQIGGWNRRISLTEIPFETYSAIVDQGQSTKSRTPIPRMPTSLDPGGDITLVRLLNDFPADQVVLEVDIPDVMPEEARVLGRTVVPQYAPRDTGLVAVNAPGRPNGSSNQGRNKLTEQRAISLVRHSLEFAGWTCTRDCQADGVGYDLEFSKGSRQLHAEVKGIQGSLLTFNITPKECWRAENDRDWLLLAVTNVLSPAQAEIHVITRDRIVAADRTVTGFRLSL